MTLNQRIYGMMLLVLLLAFALRVYRLDYQSLRGDETFTIEFSAKPLAWLISNVGRIEPHPPVLYLLMHVWLHLAGGSEFAARFFSLVFGVLSISLLYRLGRLLGGAKLGLLAALLMAVGPFQVWHAQDVRIYTLWPAISLAGVLFFALLLWEEKGRYWGGYIAITLLSLYTAYLQAFIILFENALAILFWRKEPPRLIRWFACQALLFALYLPWLIFGSQMPFTYSWAGEAPTLSALFRRSLVAFSLGSTVPLLVSTFLLPPFLAILLLGFYHAYRKDGHAFAFLLLYILVPSLAMYLFTRQRAIYHERYLNVIAPAYYLTFAFGLVALRAWRRQGRAIFALGLSLFLVSGAYSLGNYYYNPQYAKSPDWRALTQHLQTKGRSGDIIIQNYHDPSLQHYYHGDLPYRMLPETYFPEPEATEEELERLLASYRRIWFLPSAADFWDPERFVESWLDRHCDRVPTIELLSPQLSLYLTPQAFLAEMEPLHANLGDQVKLLGYRLDSDAFPLKPGQTLHLTLYWRALAEMETSYTVFTHLLDADDQIWGQKDNPPLHGTYPTTEWGVGETIVDKYDIIVGEGAPPGEYVIEVGMYDAGTGERLPVLKEGKGTGEDRVLLAEVRVN